MALVIMGTLAHVAGCLDHRRFGAQRGGFPLDSWIHCNVAGRFGGGRVMPKPGGMQLPLDAQIIEDWLLNGVPGP